MTDTKIASHLVECFESPLRDLTFSDDGQYLMGGRKISGQLVVLQVTPFMSKRVLALGEGDTRHKNINWECQISELSADRSASVLAKMCQSSPFREGPVVTSDSTMSPFKNPQGNMNISTVRCHPGTNAVTYETLHSNGSVVEQTITLLPKSSTFEKSYPALITDANVRSNKVRLVLNMAAQESYSASERADFNLPLIIDRAIDSIPTKYRTQTPGMPYDKSRTGQSSTLRLEDSQPRQSDENGNAVDESTGGEKMSMLACLGGSI